MSMEVLVIQVRFSNLINFPCKQQFISEVAVVREIVVVMGHSYPNMFQDKGEIGNLETN